MFEIEPCYPPHKAKDWYLVIPNPRLQACELIHPITDDNSVMPFTGADVDAFLNRYYLSALDVI